MLDSLRNKVASGQRLQPRYFPVNIAKLLRTPILNNICERLLLFVTCIALESFLVVYHVNAHEIQY